MHMYLLVKSALLALHNHSGLSLRFSQRRVAIGPHMSALFMNYDLVWFQIHEMLRIEGDGEEQVQDELQVKQLRRLLCLLLTAHRLSGIQSPGASKE